MLSKLLTRFRKAEGPPPVIALELRNESIRYASLKPSVDTSGAPYLLHASGLVERSAFPDDTSWREEASRQIKKYTLKKFRIFPTKGNDLKILENSNEKT